MHKIPGRVLALSAMLAFAGLFPAIAQSEASAPAATTVPAEAAARSVLWPDFQVGQHVVLEMSYLDTAKAPKPTLATIDLDVIDKTDDVFTIRWKTSNARIPAALSGSPAAKFESLWNGTSGPTLEVLIQEDVGIIGLKNWEAARDEMLAASKRTLTGLPDETGSPASPEYIDAIVESLRKAVLSSQDAVESTLLKNVRGYFDGSYHEVAPGTSTTEDLDLPWPFGDDAEALVLPMTRATAVASVATDPAPVYELTMTMSVDSERFKELMQKFREEMADNLKNQNTDELAQSDIEIKLRWRLDTAKGWPTRASSSTRTSRGKDAKTETTSWTLVEGPTMKGAEPAEGAKAAQPDPAPKPDATQPAPK